MSEGHAERLEAALSTRYRIERKLGEGGMAAVYLAADLKHGRRVALKVLRPELAAVIGAERFLSEIRTTANLQHPHILPLFDSGEAGGYLYYVMPYVEGETLRDKLDREKQLGIQESVRIARDVADALDYAHRHGVIHRDIKPANILLHDGRPVVADFGIALAVSAAGGGRMTETGLSLGTPHYMSPEQASAERDISARSDVYSLGCVLYEMIAGEPPHTGPSAQSILVHILTKEVTPLSERRHTVPAYVAGAVTKSIERLPADRFETARAFRDALDDAGFSYQVAPRAANARGVTVATSTPGGARPWLHDRRTWAAMVLVGMTSAVAVWSLSRPQPTMSVARYSIATPAEQRFRVPGAMAGLSLDPFGDWFVYTGDGEGPQRHLWLRRHDQLLATPLPGTEGAGNPSVSPDGTKVVFTTGPGNRQMRLMVSTIGGGPPVLVEDSLVDLGGVSWGHDGYIYYDANLEGDGIARVPEGGGRPERVTIPRTEDGEVWHSAPDALPNGRGLLFQVRKVDLTFDVAAVDLDTGTHEILVPGGMGPRYSPTGHLMYVSEDGSLLAAPFDQDELALTGDAVAILGGVQTRTNGRSDLVLAPDGTLMYTAGVAAGPLEMVWVTRDGEVSPIDPAWPSAQFMNPALSPDGRQLAVTVVQNNEPQIWVKQLPAGRFARFTPQGRNDRAVWTDNGRTLAYLSNRGENFDLYRQPSDGTAPPELVLDGELNIGQAILSPGGEWIVYAMGSEGIFGVPLDSSGAAAGESRRLVGGGARQPRRPALPPDGAWLAYESNESGVYSVYVCPFPICEVAYAVAPGSGWPAWTRGGRELVYIDPVAQSFMAVEVLPGAPSAWGTARELFSVNTFSLAAGAYDVTPDGERFVMMRFEGADDAPELIMVRNFFQVLRESVPN